jgi:hypothetical protein
MKRISLLLPLWIFMFIIGVGCDNANNSADTSTKDTTATKDTIKVDPKDFSDPH